MASRPPRRIATPSMQALVDHHGLPRLQPVDDIPYNAEEVEIAADSGSEEEDEVEVIEESGSDEDGQLSDMDEIMCENGDATADNDDFWVGGDGTRWKKQPIQAPARRRPANIVREASGITNECDIMSMTTIFSSLFTEEIQEIIVRYTNMYATKWIAQHEPDGGWYTNRWQPLNIIELRGFIGCLIFVGTLHAQHEALEELWAKDIGRPQLYATMSLKRFQAIMKFLRYDDTDTREERRSTDKLAPIRQLWDLFQERCRVCYKPGAFLTIDEQLVPFRGRCPFRVYMKSKPDKYGIKIWVVADSELHYALNSQVYLGKVGNNQEVGQGQRVVEDLSRIYYGTGRNITCDNFFTSIPLAKSLLQKNLTLVGTIRANKKELPREFLKNRRREENSSIFGFQNDITIVSYVPKKSRAVNLLSTQHHTNSISEREDRKPDIILMYNSTKGAVDTVDQSVHTYSCARQTRRWPNKILFNILDVACLNSFLLWKVSHPDWNRNKNFKRRLFLIELSKSLMREQMQARAAVPQLRLNIRNALSSCGIDIPEQAQVARQGPPAGLGRCHLCQERRLARVVCNVCNRHTCKIHSEKTVVCDSCRK